MGVLWHGPPLFVSVEKKILAIASLPKNLRMCYTCADPYSEAYAKVATGTPDCTKFRELLKGIKTRSRKKLMKIKSLDVFKKKCANLTNGQSALNPYLTNKITNNITKTLISTPPPYADCFYTGTWDKRVVGYEARGCASGPVSMPAEPGEGCQYINKKNDKDVEFTLFNCVCDTELCNAAEPLKGYVTVPLCHSIILVMSQDLHIDSLVFQRVDVDRPHHLDPRHHVPIQPSTTILTPRNHLPITTIRRDNQSKCTLWNYAVTIQLFNVNVI